MANIPPAKVFQIKVTLSGVRPPEWQRLLAPSSVSLRKFHDILQIALGHTDFHLPVSKSTDRVSKKAQAIMTVSPQTATEIGMRLAPSQGPPKQKPSAMRYIAP